jgi:hypothetical protein
LIHFIVKDINLQKFINIDICMTILNNVAIYIEYLPLETQQNQWSLVIQELETLFHQMYLSLTKSFDYTSLFMIMSTLLKLNYTTSCKVNINKKKSQ